MPLLWRGATVALPATGQADPARDALIVETILRIEGFDLTGSPRHREPSNATSRTTGAKSGISI